ncbi:hypothetical protein EHQ53_15540 [Leptospira langatensis]|uniref:O-antigen ligase domain-containing protein n=1 Tax=Leptospira langatensis TaxID=2484983 RepID=A0A5F1ZQF4_9LEPT|nr:hypothetical protein [Leptospira langatensis]TGK01996.1 hypothetical protein EHO57_08780 [Leptospira langatensis]TGL39550.1 hypothetical protein EHQ53_15540 [Leptospira langatensis]
MLRWTLLVRDPDGNLGIVWIQFLAGMIPNLHHRKSGRIFTAAFALLSPGLLLYGEGGYLYLSALFSGAVFGIFLRQYVSTFYAHTANDDDPVLRYFYINRPYKNSLEFTKNPKTGFLLIGVFLLFDRLLAYFGTDPITSWILPDLEYSAGISSKYAFALTLDGIGSWLSALLYFLAEETSSHDTDPPGKHWKTGITAGFTANLILGAMQGLAPETDFPFTAGNAETFGVSGFFPDAASFGLGMPILFGFFFYQIHSRNWRRFSRAILSIAVFLALGLAGRYQSTGYWLLLIFQTALVVGLSYQRSFRNPILKYSFIPIVILGTCAVLAGVYMIGGMDWSFTSWQLLREDASNAWVKGKTFSKFLEFFWKDGWIQTLSAWNWWKEMPFFGQGFGGFALHWIESGPRGGYPANGIQDFGLTSWIFLLSEGGLLFFLLFFVWVGLEAYTRSNYWFLPLLFFPVCFFEPWTGGAGILAFFLIWLLSSSAASTNTLPKWWMIPAFNLVCLVFGLALTVRSFVKLSSQLQGPEFRYEERKTYQLSAKAKNVEKLGARFHSFRSGASWILGDKGNISLRIALDEGPKPGKPVYIRWIFSDQNGVELQSRNTPLTSIASQVGLGVPGGAKFLTAKVLRTTWYQAGPSEFFISTEDFDGLNRIR